MNAVSSSPALGIIAQMNRRWRTPRKRTTAEPVLKRTYNLRCWVGDGPRFDIAMSVSVARKVAHLKNTIEKIDAEIPLDTLIQASKENDELSVPMQMGDRLISIKRQSLVSALQAFQLYK